jgi:uncharacterized protein (TIGR02646 family)
VDRDDWLVDPASSLPIEFKEYGEAKPHLEKQLGRYCSYCEMPIGNQPAAEHIEPKVHRPELEPKWCNLLLACATCNRIKWDQLVALDDCLWPDRDNTARAFAYGEGGTVAVLAALAGIDAVRASRAIALVGLDRRPGGVTEPTPRDLRWKDRSEAWDKARRARGRLARGDTADMREIIVDLAKATGFWSVWMTVFSGDPDMRGRFIGAFPGTSRACFDDQTRPVARPTGAL